MATIQINLTCELQEAVKVRYLDGNLFSQDNQGNQINITVFDNGEPATLGGSVTANVLLSDGSTVPATGGTITGNVVSITLPAAAYAVPGLASIIVKVTASGVITTIAALVANVYQSSTDTVIDPGTIIPSIQDLIDDIETAVASIPADYSSLWTSLAPAFSSSTSYVAGQYVTYNGSLYRFSTAHSGSWSSSDVTTVNIGGELSDIKSAIDVLFEKNVIDFSTAQTKNAIIGSSSGKWSDNAGNYSYFIPVTENDMTITVTAGETVSVVALLKTDTSVVGTYPDYATGGSRVSIPTGESREFDIPADCHFVCIMKSAGGTSYEPTNAFFTTKKKLLDRTDTTLSENGEAADAKVTGDAIKKVTDVITETEIVDIGSAKVIKGLITTNNRWSMTSGFFSYAFNIEKNYYKLTVTANENLNTYVGLLKNSVLINQETPPYCNGITNRITVPADETIDIDIPSDCTYIVIMKESNVGNHAPVSITFKKWGISPSQAIPLGLHEMPASESALNIVKRCRQLTDVKWTPAVDLYRYMLVQRLGEIPETAVSQNYFGTFKAGTEYTGIPYGRVTDTMDAYGYRFATVAHYIPLETFISSVCNPDSKLCKEDVHSLSNHSSVLYATVCSGLTCYALNVAEVGTTSIQNISGLSAIGKINDDGTEIPDSSFRIGDVLNLAGYHTAIITDIVRDSEGIIQIVELSDASTAGLADSNYSDGQIGGVCRRKGWTREQLYSPYSWGDYTLCRYTGNVPYTPSPYVNVGDEFNMQRIEHFPCMPYEGNKFTYKTGYIPNNTIKILISLSGYGYLKVFKDGTEISGSPFTVTNETASIDISEISAGVYTAYLCNITDGNVVNLTYPCEWTITE